MNTAAEESLGRALVEAEEDLERAENEINNRAKLLADFRERHALLALTVRELKEELA